MNDTIVKLVKENSEKEIYENNSAQWISEALQISRNEVASILNSLYKKEVLIKIESRPILYIDREIAEMKVNKPLQNIYKKVEDIFFVQEETKKDFYNLIGYDGSLAELVKQCKATIAYPPKGLPMMLYGPTGTGKSFIAKLTYEYAKRKEILTSEGKFISVNCSEYANNPELLTANLFGHVKGAFTGADKDNSGLVSLADGGVLFLDEVHNLKAECQEKLFLLMDQSIYHRVGDNEKWYESDVRIIFATTENPEEVLLKTLQRRIPMTITVPSLDERGMQERVQLLYSMLKEEEKRLNKKIKISSKVYNILISYEFTGNIGGLKSCIQSCCVNSLFEVNDQKEMLIQLHSLPKYMLNEYANKNQLASSVNEYIDIDELLKFTHKGKGIIRLNDQFIKVYQSLEEGKLNKEDCLSEFEQVVRNYFDDLLFKKTEQEEKDFYQNGVEHIFNLVAGRYGLKVSNNDLIAISNYLSDYHRDYHSFRNWMIQNDIMCEKFSKYMKEEYYREYSISVEITRYLKSYLDMDMFNMVQITLQIYIKSLNKEETDRLRIAVILAHGFSTASSIADATNKFLGKYIFDAIDMPLNVPSNIIVQELNTYLSRVGRFEELLLLVDMGSLEEIYKGLDVKNANIGIINNISTKAALGIGNGILQNQTMEEIFMDVIEYTNISYHIEKNRQKEEIILCSCASGLGTAEKLRKIIQDSLPKNVSISVKTYNYNDLLEKGFSDTFFNDYHVLCVIGTLNPNIEELNFIPIEDLIINDNLNELDVYLKDYLDKGKLDYFKKNILKNFSLSNIMNSLTILNPTKLLEHVAEAIDKLQISLEIKFSNNTCFGLYVHISCLIERLVMHKEIDIYDMEEFEKTQKKFITLIKQTFQEVEIYYGVEIPVAEIGYIYDYVKNDINFS